MRSATHNRFWPDRLGLQTGGYCATQLNGLGTIVAAVLFRPIPVKPIQTLVPSVLLIWSLPIAEGQSTEEFKLCKVYKCALH